MASAARASGKPVPDGFQGVTEGKATVLFPAGQEVFYNKAQVYNRDITVMALNMFGELMAEESEKSYGEAVARWEKAKAGGEAGTEPRRLYDGLHVVDALSASGLRALRYLKEVEHVAKATANDLDPKAGEAIRRNAAFNDVPEGKLQVEVGDASSLLYAHRAPADRFHVVDLDPYGSAAPFLDAAVQSVANHGMLMVTCTDTATLSGPNQDACFGRYGCVAIRGVYHHELSVRMLLTALRQCAARYGRHIQPLLCLSVDFYIRVFVRVKTRKSEVLRSPLETGMVMQPLGEERGKKTVPANAIGGGPCPECGGRVMLGGPYYTGPLQDVPFVDRAIAHLESDDGKGRYATADRILGVLRVAREELPASPLYYDLHATSGALSLSAPTLLTFQSALANAGYRFSQYHGRSTAVKTDAPTSFVMDVMRAWAKEKPLSKKKLAKNAVLKQFFEKPCQHEVDFEHAAAVRLSRKAVKSQPRFVPSEAHWGPMGRAGRKRPRPAAAAAEAEAEAEEEGEGSGAAAAKE